MILATVVLVLESRYLYSFDWTHYFRKSDLDLGLGNSLGFGLGLGIEVCGLMLVSKSALHCISHIFSYLTDYWKHVSNGR